MAARVLDGKARSAQVRGEIAETVAALRDKHGIEVCLAVLIVGEDPASQVYVRNKVAACEQAGIRSLHERFAADTTQQALLARIAELNADASVHGILVQLPLPAHIDRQTVLEAIAVAKDVDGFHAENAGRLSHNDASAMVACTPRGVMDLLAQAGVTLQGAEAVVIGRSDIVGKPMAMLLTNAGATVTVCHSKTRDLAAHLRRADIVVAAVGKPRMVTGAMLKPGAVVIDVGINRQPDGKLCGDVDYASAAEVASAITPVPGGVGPMTIAMLLANTVDAACRQHGVTL